MVLLAGGVGGARLAHGLQVHLGDHLTIIVNTGDDLERLGLLVCPDHDTVMYTLAGIDNKTLPLVAHIIIPQPTAPPPRDASGKPL